MSKWSRAEHRILERYYPVGGSKLVRAMLERIDRTRSEEAIRGRVKGMGLRCHRVRGGSIDGPTARLIRELYPHLGGKITAQRIEAAGLAPRTPEAIRAWACRHDIACTPQGQVRARSHPYRSGVAPDVVAAVEAAKAGLWRDGIDE